MLYICVSVSRQVKNEIGPMSDGILFPISRFVSCIAEVLLLQRNCLAYRSSEGWPHIELPVLAEPSDIVSQSHSQVINRSARYEQ